MLPENIMKTYLPKHSHLIACREYQKAVIFGIKTRILLFNLCAKDEDRDEAAEEIHALTNEARLARYNEQWEVNLIPEDN